MNQQQWQNSSLPAYPPQPAAPFDPFGPTPPPNPAPLDPFGRKCFCGAGGVEPDRIQAVPRLTGQQRLKQVVGIYNFRVYIQQEDECPVAYARRKLKYWFEAKPGVFSEDILEFTDKAIRGFTHPGVQRRLIDKEQGISNLRTEWMPAVRTAMRTEVTLYREELTEEGPDGLYGDEACQAKGCCSVEALFRD